MTFTGIVTNAMAGMNASTLRAEILSYNIANAETEGFARRSVSFEAVVPGGVRSTGIVRADAGRLELQLLDAQTRTSAFEDRAEALSAINQGFGEVGDTEGLYAVFSRFEEALSDLRLTPESGAAQLSFLREAQGVADTFARLDDEAQAIRFNADATIADGVRSINDALTELDDLNTAARRPKGVSIDDIAERQSQLVGQIADQLDITVSGSYGEEISIRTKGGYQLLGEDPQFLEFTKAGSMGFDFTLASGALSGLTAGGYDITPGTTQGIADGRLAANFAIRDVLGTDYANRLDAAAEELVVRLEAADTTATGGLFTLTAGLDSAAQRMAIDPSVDPAQGGELYRLRDGVGALVEGPAAGAGVLGALKIALDEPRPLPVATGTSSEYSYLDMLGTVASELGSASLRAQGLRDAALSTQTTLSEDVVRRIGVDTDRELQDLLLVEQAFAANARVIQAADEMLRQLLEI
ncbi:MAG: flagellar basal body rod C-terminal domain-containing protein [Pseudomonadota bacterium]